ncbi:ABC-type metal ion transport system, periplasmic component/surface antigen [Sanguibacter keddieii DSM 10542]|jgi:D-methionine transport system substrate-binding protein|uniref:ABC-type metal ion transport system, periplasmic component/surface antigen n=1 Tax=Sanguibacter keddieii (strain ATCC 51767 / DSM 10542 / NCFB 3025 / ST-74) TaxID=446469 RepID=D1BKF3_SANKS|nr:MetQ/NlpA family ABC transporter substrate-binding protein [Sanguibacter keddieii]ACZ20430.1 ABC-type metal ion transport system, periplasmic component/surface antigen [Sanguibacter keddieii DSM 10542]
MSRSTRTARTLGAASLVAALTLGLAACSSDDASSDAAKGDESNPVVIGVVNAAADDQWSVFEEQAEAEGIYVEIKDLGSYDLPNAALTSEELDLNQFQHLQYLAEYNTNTGEDLTPIGATAVYPLSLYSSKYTSVDEIPAGAEIAIPNDPTNLARALLVLQDAGLLELKDGGSSVSTELDVLPSSTVTVTPVDATQTAVNLDSIDGAVVNNDFIKDAGLAAEDALYQDSAEAEGARPYINVWVSRAADKDDETFLKLVEISHSPEVEAALLEASGDSAVIADQDGPTLQGYLDEIQANLQG